jgi:hypothetical protein
LQVKPIRRVKEAAGQVIPKSLLGHFWISESWRINNVKAVDLFSLNFSGHRLYCFFGGEFTFEILNVENLVAVIQDVV